MRITEEDWPNNVSNEELRRRIRQILMDDVSKRWIGHKLKRLTIVLLATPNAARNSWDLHEIYLEWLRPRTLATWYYRNRDNIPSTYVSAKFPGDVFLARLFTDGSFMVTVEMSTSWSELLVGSSVQL